MKMQIDGGCRRSGYSNAIGAAACVQVMRRGWTVCNPQNLIFSSHPWSDCISHCLRLFHTFKWRYNIKTWHIKRGCTRRPWVDKCQISSSLRSHQTVQVNMQVGPSWSFCPCSGFSRNHLLMERHITLTFKLACYDTMPTWEPKPYEPESGTYCHNLGTRECNRKIQLSRVASTARCHNSFWFSVRDWLYDGMDRQKVPERVDEFERPSSF